MSHDFGFRVVRFGPGEWDGEDSPEGWRVNLPHQCDEWEIAGEKYEQPPTHAEAVADLTAFIWQASEALRRLERREEGS